MYCYILLLSPNLKRFAFERGGEAVEAVEEVESAAERLVATAEETELESFERLVVETYIDVIPSANCQGNVAQAGVVEIDIATEPLLVAFHILGRHCHRSVA